MHRAMRLNLWRDAAIRFSRNKLAVASWFVVFMFVFMALFADVISPTPYDKTNLTQSRKFPSLKYPMGTDTIGRNQLSRIIYGARVSLSIGLSVQLLAVVIGVSLGAAAGFLGGWVDTIVMGTIEVFTAIPQLLFALFLLCISQDDC